MAQVRTPKRGKILGLSWQDIDFAARKIMLRQQVVYHNKSYYFSTLKNKSSSHYILVDDYLLGELQRWQNQQTENEKEFGNSYVYREEDGNIERRSKGLSAPA